MIKIVYNKLLRGWYVVRGRHHFPLAGRFETKAAARAWLDRSVPDLEPRCGSWTIVNRATGKAVFETFTKSIAQRVRQDTHEVLTTAQWLARVNGRGR